MPPRPPSSSSAWSTCSTPPLGTGASTPPAVSSTNATSSTTSRATRCGSRSRRPELLHHDARRCAGRSGSDRGCRSLRRTQLRPNRRRVGHDRRVSRASTTAFRPPRSGVPRHALAWHDAARRRPATCCADPHASHRGARAGTRTVEPDRRPRRQVGRARRRARSLDPTTAQRSDPSGDADVTGLALIAELTRVVDQLQRHVDQLRPAGRTGSLMWDLGMPPQSRRPPSPMEPWTEFDASASRQQPDFDATRSRRRPRGALLAQPRPRGCGDHRDVRRRPGAGSTRCRGRHEDAPAMDRGGPPPTLHRVRGRCVSAPRCRHHPRRRSCVDGEPDRDRFRSVIGTLLSDVCARNPGGVSVYGEMVGLLWSQGRAAAAMRLEEHWNELQRELPFSLLCGYLIDGSPDSTDLDTIRHAPHLRRLTRPRHADRRPRSVVCHDRGRCCNTAARGAAPHDGRRGIGSRVVPGALGTLSPTSGVRVLESRGGRLPTLTGT